MRLIIIYGPPASGKLTIAELVSQQTSIPLFHNHVTRDIVKDIYGEKLDENYELVDKLRSDVFSHCSKNGTDLLFTYVYGGSGDDVKVQSFIEVVESNGGEVFFVELAARRDDLLSRVDSESRKRFQKLHDPVILKTITEDLAKYSIPFVDALVINTSQNSAAESASLIIDKLGLTRANG